MITLYEPGLASVISKEPFITGALNVSVDDSAQARTPPSAGETVPLIEPLLRLLKANSPAAANVITASLIPVNFILREFKE